MSEDLVERIPVIEPPQAAPSETVDPNDSLEGLQIQTQRHSLETLKHQLAEAKTMGWWRLVFAAASALGHTNTATTERSYLSGS